MASDPQTRLPNELWREIFRIVLDTEYKTTTLRALSCVSKAFSPIAEAVMLRSVSISSYAQLVAFEQKLFRARSVAHTSPAFACGPLVQELTLYGSDISTITSEGRDVEGARVHDILAHALQALTMLRTLNLYHFRANFATMNSVAQAAGRTLVNLSVDIDLGHDDSRGIFASIGRLMQLEAIEVTVSDSQPSDPLGWTTETALHLPKIQSVNWAINNKRDCSSLLSYLARCNFHPKCTLCLGLPSWGIIASDSTCFFPFFDTHRPREIGLQCSEEILRMLWSRIARSERVAISGSLPLDMLGHGDLPRFLILNVDVTQEDYVDEFWTLLRAMEARLDLRPNVTRIGIILRSECDPSEFGSQFSWTGDDFLWDETVEEFVESLIPLAKPLFEKGIRIVDNCGRDVQCLED